MTRVFSMRSLSGHVRVKVLSLRRRRRRRGGGRWVKSHSFVAYRSASTRRRWPGKSPRRTASAGAGGSADFAARRAAENAAAADAADCLLRDRPRIVIIIPQPSTVVVRRQTHIIAQI